MFSLVAEVTLLHTLVVPAPVLLLASCRALSNCTAEQIAETEKESHGTVRLLETKKQQCYLPGRQQGGLALLKLLIRYHQGVAAECMRSLSVALYAERRCQRVRDMRDLAFTATGCSAAFPMYHSGSHTHGRTR